MFVFVFVFDCEAMSSVYMGARIIEMCMIKNVQIK